MTNGAMTSLAVAETNTLPPAGVDAVDGDTLGSWRLEGQNCLVTRRRTSTLLESSVKGIQGHVAVSHHASTKATDALQFVCEHGREERHSQANNTNAMV